MSNYEFIGGPFGFTESPKNSKSADDSPEQAESPELTRRANDGKPDWQLAWKKATLHRENIAKLILASLPHPSLDSNQPTLCVLGAGSCLDLAFEELGHRFSKITLVDLDGDLIRGTAAALKLDHSSKISIVGDFDVTGINGLLTKYGQEPNADLLAKIKTAGSNFGVAASGKLGKFDVVVSTCLLSQLNNQLVECIEDDSVLAEMLVLMRRWHLSVMLGLTKPSGRSIIITDLISSLELPELDQQEFWLSEKSWSEIAKGKHFPGMNLVGIEQELNRLEKTKTVRNSQTSRPWIWTTRDKRFACVGFCLFK